MADETVVVGTVVPLTEAAKVAAKQSTAAAAADEEIEVRHDVP